MWSIGILAFLGCAVIGIVLFALIYHMGEQWKILRRKWRAIQSGAPRGTVFPEQYQPLTRHVAWREPIPLLATGPCPHCGFYDTHMMTQPRPDKAHYKMNPETGRYRLMTLSPFGKQIAHGDHPDAATVRNCKVCGHMWGEK